MKITLKVSMKNSDGGTNASRVNSTLEEFVADRAATTAEAGRLAIEEMEARDARNDKSRTWTVESVEQTRS